MIGMRRCPFSSYIRMDTSTFVPEICVGFRVRRGTVSFAQYQDDKIWSGCHI